MPQLPRGTQASLPQYCGRRRQPAGAVLRSFLSLARIQRRGRFPDDIGDDLATIFDPFGNAVHTALSFDLAGEDVLITGAGPIGMMAAAICRHAGARQVVVTDVNDYRLGLAAQLGATQNGQRCADRIDEARQKLSSDEGFTVGLEMSGNQQAIHAMLDAMANGGKIALLGIPPGDIAIDWNKIIFKGLTLKGIYGREMFETWHKMTAIAAERPGYPPGPSLIICRSTGFKRDLRS